MLWVRKEWSRVEHPRYAVIKTPLCSVDLIMAVGVEHSNQRKELAVRWCHRVIRNEEKKKQTTVIIRGALLAKAKRPVAKAAVGQCCAKLCVACNTQARFHNVFILNLFNCYIFLRAKAFSIRQKEVSLVFYLDLPMSSSDTSDLNLSCCAICQRMRDFQTNGISHSSG